MQGQKIPTLGGGEQFSGTPAMEPESKQEASKIITPCSYLLNFKTLFYHSCTAILKACTACTAI